MFLIKIYLIKCLAVTDAYQSSFQLVMVRDGRACKLCILSTISNLVEESVNVILYRLGCGQLLAAG